MMPNLPRSRRLPAPGPRRASDLLSLQHPRRAQSRASHQRHRTPFPRGPPKNPAHGGLPGHNLDGPYPLRRLQPRKQNAGNLNPFRPDTNPLTLTHPALQQQALVRRCSWVQSVGQGEVDRASALIRNRISRRLAGSGRRDARDFPPGDAACRSARKAAGPDHGKAGDSGTRRFARRSRCRAGAARASSRACQGRVDGAASGGRPTVGQDHCA